MLVTADPRLLNIDRQYHHPAYRQRYVYPMRWNRYRMHELPFQMLLIRYRLQLQHSFHLHQLHVPMLLRPYQLLLYNCQMR